MDEFDIKLNDILVDTYRSILKVEEQAIKNSGKNDLSINEMHLIEAVGKSKDGERTISDIAQEIGVTLPSVTVAINRLAKKGYVVKTKGANDGRMVYVSLTKLGRKMDHAHRYFHEQMIRKVSAGFSPEEKMILIEAINRLNGFFKRKGGDLGEI